jgi:head-tail adaptor
MTAPFPIGGLRQAVRLHAPSDAPDGQGGLIRSFALFATVFGALETVGEAAVIDERLSQRRAARLTIRWSEGLAAAIAGGWRAEIGGRSYEVLAVGDPDGGRRALRLELEVVSP